MFTNLIRSTPLYYIILKVVQGNFNQSDPRFGSSAGTQCAANALMFICWSYIKTERYWVSHDLDDILSCGDSTYKEKGWQLWLS